MKSSFSYGGTLLVVLLCGVATALGLGFLKITGDDDRTPVKVFSRIESFASSSLPELTDGFSDWAHCSHEDRVESHPGGFRMVHWGPAGLANASGCGTCGGKVTFTGNPQTAGLGLALAPPHDMSSDAGQLPPDGHDHPNVLASTGEVVYTEVDFVIPGVGFDLIWSRTYRSAYEFSGEIARSVHKIRRILFG